MLAFVITLLFAQDVGMAKASPTVARSFVSDASIQFNPAPSLDEVHVQGTLGTEFSAIKNGDVFQFSLGDINRSIPFSAFQLKDSTYVLGNDFDHGGIGQPNGESFRIEIDRNSGDFRIDGIARTFRDEFTNNMSFSMSFGKYSQCASLVFDETSTPWHLLSRPISKQHCDLPYRPHLSQKTIHSGKKVPLQITFNVPDEIAPKISQLDAYVVDSKIQPVGAPLCSLKRSTFVLPFVCSEPSIEVKKLTRIHIAVRAVIGKRIEFSPSASLEVYPTLSDQDVKQLAETQRRVDAIVEAAIKNIPAKDRASLAKAARSVIPAVLAVPGVQSADVSDRGVEGSLWITYDAGLTQVRTLWRDPGID